jgi:hypothetical protein
MRCLRRRTRLQRRRPRRRICHSITKPTTEEPPGPAATDEDSASEEDELAVESTSDAHALKKIRRSSLASQSRISRSVLHEPPCQALFPTCQQTSLSRENRMCNSLAIPSAGQCAQDLCVPDASRLRSTSTILRSTCRKRTTSW